MSKSPAFQFYVNDWLSSKNVARMTLEQQGAYIRLLCYAWDDEDCGLDDDDDELAFLSGLKEGWFKGSSTVLRRCFEAKDGRLYNVRLLEERQKQKEWREKCSSGGKASAKSRRAKALEAVKGSSPLVEVKGSSLSLSSSSSSNKTPIVPKGTQYTDEFLKFWMMHPRKKGKKVAFRAWGRAKSDASADEIIQGLRNLHAAIAAGKEDPAYVKYPATWLNAAGWLDEYDGPATRKQFKQSTATCTTCGDTGEVPGDAMRFPCDCAKGEAEMLRQYPHGDTTDLFDTERKAAIDAAERG